MGDEVKDDIPVEPEPEVEKIVKAKPVVLDPAQLKDASIEMAVRDIEVPQLNRLMGLAEGEVAVVKITQLTLNQYLSCRGKMEDKIRNIIEGVIAAAEEVGELEKEIISGYKELQPQTRYYIDVCLAGVVEPKMPRNKWAFLAKSFPMIVERIAAEVIMLTKGGADLKKNS